MTSTGTDSKDDAAQALAEWPEPLREAFDQPLVASTGREAVLWPELEASSRQSWGWLLQHRRLIVRCVTWNLCGLQPPSKEEIQKLVIPLNR